MAEYPVLDGSGNVLIAASNSGKRFTGLRSSPTIAFLGDSITAQGFGGSLAGGYTFASVGFVPWAAFLSRRRFNLGPECNFGVAGETSAQILARLGPVLAMRPTACVVLAGTNDIGALTPAQSIANLGAIYDALANAGITTIAIAIPPRGGITTAQYGKILQVNQWIASQRFTRPHFFTLDVSLAYGDPTTGAPRTTMSGDQLHPNVYGAYTIGAALAALLATMYPETTPVFSNPLDVYSAADNPTGNLLGSAGLMAGTTGTLSNGPTGSLATGWAANGVNLPAGATAVFSKVAKADGRSVQQLVLGGNYNSASPASFNVTAPVVQASCAAGETLEAYMELETDAGALNFSGAQLLIDIATPSGSPVPIDFVANNTHTFPPVAFDGLLKTPRVTLPATPTLVRLTARFTIKGVGVASNLAATMRFGSASLRKVS